MLSLLWYLIGRTVRLWSKKNSDAANYKQNVVTVFEEIRDELKISNNSKNKNTNEPL
ncbi:MAG TPA: hypothetical protein VF842_06355 [Flavobacterium sp.]